MRNPFIFLLALSMYEVTKQDNVCLSKPETDLLATIKSSLQKLEAKLKGKKSFHCPSGWEEFSGHCYSFRAEKRNWMDSEIHCRQSGGYLVKIESKKEQQWINSRAKEKSFHNAWIGVRNLNRKWVWITDTREPKVKFWKSGEPSGDGDCVGLHSTIDWNDRICSYRAFFICERNLNSKCLPYSRPTRRR